MIRWGLVGAILFTTACGGAGRTTATPGRSSKAAARNVEFADHGWNEMETSDRGSNGLLPVAPQGAFNLVDDGEGFMGTHRAAAKTKPAAGPAHGVALATLLAEFQPGKPRSDERMRAHSPPISEDATSDRVPEEMQNVTIDGWVLAAKKEDDNDFHMIVAADPALADQTDPDRWMLVNVEISALPPDNADGRSSLVSARESFKAYFVPVVPDKVVPKYTALVPVHVRITGSIFFDVDHKPGAVGPGPLKPATSWEIHPVTRLEVLD